MPGLIKKTGLLLWLVLLAVLPACTAAPAPAPADSKLKVMATTTIVGDVVRQVGGQAVAVTTLLPVGADPHTFQPTPREVAQVADARVIFANGAGLEEFLKPMLENAGGGAQVISLSDGIQLLQAGDESGEPAHPGEDDHSAGDPHTWFDPQNVILWTQVIEKKLGELDPSDAATYTANAQAYRAELRGLDEWIQSQVEQLPAENRKLVTDHTSFTYFAARYGFEQVGALVPAYSTLAQPSAQELAALEESIRSLGVKAVFVEQAANPTLAQRVAQDSGVPVVPLYNGSLSAPGGPAGTYIDFMRYNVAAIVKALQ